MGSILGTSHCKGDVHSVGRLEAKVCKLLVGSPRRTTLALQTYRGLLTGPIGTEGDLVKVGLWKVVGSKLRDSRLPMVSQD